MPSPLVPVLRPAPLGAALALPPWTTHATYQHIYGQPGMVQEHSMVLELLNKAHGLITPLLSKLPGEAKGQREPFAPRPKLVAEDSERQRLAMAGKVESESEPEAAELQAPNTGPA